MSKHTPGPWTMCFRSGDMSEGTVERGSDLVAIVCGANYGAWRDAPDEGDAEFEANTRLIAAAPDLLAALKSALGALEEMQRIWAPHAAANGFSTKDSAMIVSLKAAIAKAEGLNAVGEQVRA